MKITPAMEAVRHEPSMSSKYIPQYRPGTQYNFSTLEGFTPQTGSVSESIAKSALRILIDFMKSETMKNKDLAYEPLLTQLIDLKLY